MRLNHLNSKKCRHTELPDCDFIYLFIYSFYFTQQNCHTFLVKTTHSKYPTSISFFLAWLLAFVRSFTWLVRQLQINYATDKRRERLLKYQKPCQKETSARRVTNKPPIPHNKLGSLKGLCHGSPVHFV